jgi:transcription antitermination factor NusG
MSKSIGKDGGGAIPGSGDWFALSVMARHEKAVSSLLSDKGFETFLPLWRRRHRYQRRVRDFELPLFPGYLFCRFDATSRLLILTTPGVVRLVGAGRTPISVDEQEVAALQQASQAEVIMQPHPYWRSGQKGYITSGALAGIEGTVVSLRNPARLILSVSLLQRSVLLELDSDCVALLEEGSAETASHA